MEGRIRDLLDRIVVDPRPEAYIQFTPGLVTDDGAVADDSTADFPKRYMAELGAFVSRVYMVLPRTV